MKGTLSTHVLDIYHGKPAAGMAITLHAIDSIGRSRAIKNVTTNADGRTDEPLLTGEAFERGRYELQFAVSEYFELEMPHQSDPPFLEIVPIRFGVSDPAAGYHVPLLVSPWAYQTYRGS